MSDYTPEERAARIEIDFTIGPERTARLRSAIAHECRNAMQQERRRCYEIAIGYSDDDDLSASAMAAEIAGHIETVSVERHAIELQPYDEKLYDESSKPRKYQVELESPDGHKAVILTGECVGELPSVKLYGDVDGPVAAAPAKHNETPRTQQLMREAHDKGVALYGLADDYLNASCTNEIARVAFFRLMSVLAGCAVPPEGTR